MKVSLIVPAAGSGVRLALGIPKALVPVHDVPLVAHAVNAVSASHVFVERVIVAPAGSQREFTEAFSKLDPPLDVTVVPGGHTRQESVLAGLRSLEHHSDLVCIHDAARALVKPGTVTDVIKAAALTGAATAASRLADSLRQDVAGGGTEARDRSKFWLVETPQVFRRDLLLAAHERALATGDSASDDATLVERYGQRVEVVQGQGANVKVTGPADLELVRILLRPRRP